MTGAPAEMVACADAAAKTVAYLANGFPPLEDSPRGFGLETMGKAVPLAPMAAARARARYGVPVDAAEVAALIEHAIEGRQRSLARRQVTTP